MRRNAPNGEVPRPLRTFVSLWKTSGVAEGAGEGFGEAGDEFGEGPREEEDGEGEEGHADDGGEVPLGRDGPSPHGEGPMGKEDDKGAFGEARDQGAAPAVGAYVPQGHESTGGHQYNAGAEEVDHAFQNHRVGLHRREPEGEDKGGDEAHNEERHADAHSLAGREAGVQPHEKNGEEEVTDVAGKVVARADSVPGAHAVEFREVQITKEGIEECQAPEAHEEGQLPFGDLANPGGNHRHQQIEPQDDEEEPIGTGLPGEGERD